HNGGCMRHRESSRHPRHGAPDCRCRRDQAFKVRTSGMEPKAVVLVSGGLDSAKALAMGRAEGFGAHGPDIRDGQGDAIESGAARRVAEALGATEHKIIDLDLRVFGGSALTSDQEVPKDRDADEMASGIPTTYVPARNTIFLSIAMAWAEVLGADDIFIGVNAIDYSGYPDCRPEFIEAFERLAGLATRAGVEQRRRLNVRTPLIRMTKAQIIQRGLELGVDYALTVSCYDPSETGIACGRCDACALRMKGFGEAGIQDPIKYAQ